MFHVEHYILPTEFLSFPVILVPDYYMILSMPMRVITYLLLSTLLLGSMHALLLLSICWFITIPLGWMIWGTIGFLLVTFAGVGWCCTRLSKWFQRMNGMGETYLPAIAVCWSVIGGLFLYNYLIAVPGQFIWAICLYVILAGGTCSFLIYQRK